MTDEQRIAEIQARAEEATPMECSPGCRYGRTIWTNSWEHPVFTYQTHSDGCPVKGTEK